MKSVISTLILSTSLALSASVHATGLAKCESGPESRWKPQSELERMLVEKGWTVRRIKVDGSCYEVYAIDQMGERVEAYFHPVTLEPVPIEVDATE